MKKRIITIVTASLCALMLFSTSIVPTMASPYFDEETGIETRAEQVRWYYRTNHGVEEMRLWSVTYGVWKTDWIPVPDGWHQNG